MRTWRDVARYHLVVPWLVPLMPWAILACAFIVNLVIFARIPSDHPAAPHHYTGGVVAIYVMFFVVGLNIVGRSLPFGLALGVSRRSYYTGTALLGVALAFADGLVLTALQVIERASGGWGIQLHFFRVPYILAGPWYFTWLTSFVALALAFVYGMWFGIVYRRWNLYGLLAFIVAQVGVVLAAVLIVAAANAWSGVGHFFTGLTAAGLTGVLAGLALLLLAGGQATIRGATV